MAFTTNLFVDLRSYILCFIAVSNGCHAYNIHDIADPPAASVTYVGDVIQNGLPMQMKQFKTELSVTELLAFYKQRWSDISTKQDNVPHYLEKEAGEWFVLSKIESGKSVVVQVKKTGNRMTEGFISVTDITDIREPNHWSNDFPRLQGTQLMSNTESVDKGRNAYTLVLYNKLSVSENRDFYRDNMYSDGWQYARGGEKSSTTMLYFKKDKWHCDITVTEADDGKTIIFANLVEINENS
ncbi:MAG: hypothetical protein PVI97_01245 [Candidatus Thiodiazotropha sp.]|jgi:hypothetical protein